MATTSAVVQIGAASLKPVQEVVDELRLALRRAESGELRAVAYIGLMTDSTTMYGVVGPDAKGSGYPRIAGLLTWLANRCLARWDETSEEEPR